MAQNIRVGIIGANPERGWAQTAHIPALRALDGFEIVAVSTTRLGSAEATASQLGGTRAYADAPSLVADPDVDVVAICVKVPHHFELARTALEGGKHVFVEWPLAATTEQAVTLAELAEANALQSVVGLQGRESPVVNYVRDLVADGYLGRVLSTTLSLATGGRGGATVAAERVWAMDRAAGANILTITGGHEIDVLRYCVGEFREVTAMVSTAFREVRVAETGETVQATAPDTVFAQGVISNDSNPEGVRASVVIRSGASKTPGLNFDILGSHGALVVTAAGSVHLGDAGVVLRGASGEGPLAPLEVPARYHRVPAVVPEGQGRNVAGLYLDLAVALSGGPVLAPSFATAVSLHRLLDAMEESSRTGVRQILT